MTAGVDIGGARMTINAIRPLSESEAFSQFVRQPQLRSNVSEAARLWGVRERVASRWITKWPDTHGETPAIRRVSKADALDQFRQHPALAANVTAAARAWGVSRTSAREWLREFAAAPAAVPLAPGAVPAAPSAPPLAPL